MIRSQRPDVSDQNSGASVSNRPSCLAGSKFFDMVAGKLCEIGWGITRDFLNVGSHGGPTVLFVSCVQLQYRLHLPLRHSGLKHSVACSGLRYVDVIDLAIRHFGKNRCYFCDSERCRAGQRVSFSFVPFACQCLCGNRCNIARINKTSLSIPPRQINRAIARRKVSDEILHERIWPQKRERETRFTDVLFVFSVPFSKRVWWAGIGAIADSFTM